MGGDLPGTLPPPGVNPPERLPGGATHHHPVSGVHIVAVTDRHRMVPAAVLASGDWPAIAAAFGGAVSLAVAGCPAGSVIVQVREKDLDGGPLLQLVRAAQPFAPVAVNDRLDVALAAGAWGVHLPERGLAVATARAIAADAVAARAAVLASSDVAAAGSSSSPLIIGVSRHAAPGDTGADLIQLGPIWPTPSKPGATPLGEAALAWPRGSASLVAVGGIDSPDRATAATAAGADAVAVIRAAWTGDSLAAFVAAVAAGRSRR
jgi:thiamine-phosphate pyrophosphorylase